MYIYCFAITVVFVNIKVLLTIREAHLARKKLIKGCTVKFSFCQVPSILWRPFSQNVSYLTSMPINSFIFCSILMNLVSFWRGMIVCQMSQIKFRINLVYLFFSDLKSIFHRLFFYAYIVNSIKNLFLFLRKKGFVAMKDQYSYFKKPF